MTTLKNFINGKFVDHASNETMSFENPAIGQIYGTAPLSREKDVDAAFKAASDAFLGWKRTAPAVVRLRYSELQMRWKLARMKLSLLKSKTLVSHFGGCAMQNSHSV